MNILKLAVIVFVAFCLLNRRAVSQGLQTRAFVMYLVSWSAEGVRYLCCHDFMIGKHDTEYMYKHSSLGCNAYVKISETSTTNTNIYIYIYNGKTWHVKCSMNCKSRNIIYILICAKCRSFYVGQTENLRQRVTLHRQQINHEEYSHLAVSEHIRRCSNGNFQIMPIYQCDSHSSRLTRELKERDIITILQPDLNSC